MYNRHDDASMLKKRPVLYVQQYDSNCSLYRPLSTYSDYPYHVFVFVSWTVRALDTFRTHILE